MNLQSVFSKGYNNLIPLPNVVNILLNITSYWKETKVVLVFSIEWKFSKHIFPYIVT